MMRFQNRLVERLWALSAVSALAVGAAGCNEAQAGQAGNDVGYTEQELLGDLAKQCGLVCPGGKDLDGNVVLGIEGGNASISGVASVDAFFSSVVNFNAAAKASAGGIKAQLDAIRADFGIAADANLDAELKAKFNANLEAGYKIDVTPARCQADVQATLEASAKCDASVNPGQASVMCKGTCEAEVGAKLDCGAEAELKCTFTAPTVACGGSCSGECHVSVDAEGGCEGTCEGKCDGECSLKNGDGSCAGECSGKCEGTCKARLAADAKCEGKCEGECTATPPDGECSATARASCEGSATAMVECKGKCEGDFEPPSAKAECSASAKADAKVNVQCTPPSVEMSYTLKAAAGADLEAQVKFEAALKTFVNVRLPALLAALKKAEIVVEAGGELAASAEGAVKGAIDLTLKDPAKLTLKASVGLGCALGELPKAAKLVEGATGTLKAQVEAAVKITAAVGA